MNQISPKIKRPLSFWHKFFMCLAIFSALFLSFLERDVWLKPYISYQAKKYVSKHLKGDFEFSALNKEEDRWVFLNPRLINSRKGFEFQALSLALEYDFSLTDFNLEVSLEVDQPIIAFKELPQSEHSLTFLSQFPKPTLFGIKKSIVIKRACCQSDPSLFFNFSYIDEPRKTEQGFFEMISNQVPHGKVIWDKDVTKQTFSCHFEQLHLDRADTFRRLFFRNSDHWQLTKGLVDGNIYCHLSQLEGNLTCHNVELYYAPLRLKIDVQTANLLVDPLSLDHKKQFILQEIDWDDESNLLKGHVNKIFGQLSLQVDERGKVYVPELELKLDQSSTSLSTKSSAIQDLEGQLFFKNGRFYQSFLKGTWLGLNAYFDIKDKVLFEFSGHPRLLNTLLRSNSFSNLQALLDQADFKLVGEIEKISDLLSVKGLSQVDYQQKRLQIPFEFEVLADKAERPLSLTNWTLANGKFTVDELKADIFLNPFIQEKEPIELFGNLNILGTFDLEALKIHYVTDKMIVEACDFTVETSAFKDIKVKGEHYIKWDGSWHEGQASFPAGYYFEKNTGLLFTDFQGNLALKNKTIAFNSLETYCNGLFFAGEVFVDLSSPEKGVFDLQIIPQTLHGTFSQLQSLFLHFPQEQFFTHWPLEANLSLYEPALLAFHFLPNDFEMQARFKANLYDGRLNQPFEDTYVEEIAMDFELDHEKHIFQAKNLQGTLLLGSEQKVQEFELRGDHLYFSYGPEFKGDFDLWMGDQERDFVRLIGQIQPAENRERIKVELDQFLSHIGSFQIREFNLFLTTKAKLDQLQVLVDFSLEEFIQNLTDVASRLKYTPAILIKASELANQQSVKGKAELHIDYNQITAETTFQLLTQDLSIGNHQFKQGKTIVTKNGRLWSVNQFVLDHISASAELVKREQDWRVNFLGLQLGKSLLVGLEGDFQEESGLFDAQVHLLEVQLRQMRRLKDQFEFLEYLPLEGELKGNGKLVLQMGLDPQQWFAQAQIKAHLQEGKIKHLYLKDTKPFEINFDLKRGIDVQGLQASLYARVSKDSQADFTLDHLHWGWPAQQFKINQFRFTIPSQNLSWLADNLEQMFPDFFRFEISQAVRELKKHESLSGELSLYREDEFLKTEVKLKDGLYSIANQELALKDPVLTYEKDQLQMSGKWLIGDYPLQFKASTAINTHQEGQLNLWDSNDTSQPLVILWSHYPEEGLTLQKAEGWLSGLFFDLNALRDQKLPSGLHLEGSIWLDSSQRVGLAPLAVQMFLEKYKSSKCVFQGQIHYLFKELEQVQSQFYIKGKLEAEDCWVGPYCVENFNASIDLTPQYMQLKEIVLNDRAGTLEADQIMWQHAIDQQSIDIPQLQVKNFRPALVKTLDQRPLTRKKNLLVSEIKLSDLKLQLSDPQALTGWGMFRFSNTTKKVSHPLFAIPAELLSRLGLNLSALNPVKGEVQFNIKEGRVYIKRLKDVYSQGKLSKFYLPPSDHSYVDFDGNLHLNIRMKQFNLLLKFVELFTFNIRGNAKHPTYAIQRQQHELRK